MATSVTDALHHLDALLAVEAAQLTEDELLLVSDMVQELMGASSLPAGGQQQQLTASTPAGLNLAEQIQQMLPGLPQGDQLQQQVQLQHPMSTVEVAAQHLHINQQPQQHPAAASFGVTAAAAAAAVTGGGASCGLASTHQQPLRMPAAVMNVTGLASPSSSSVSGRSSPLSPAAGQPVRCVSPPRPAASQPVPGRSARVDPAAEAAADVLTAALADPNTSIEDIVGIFDKVLTAGEQGASALQQLMASQTAQLPAVQLEQPTRSQELCQPAGQQQPAGMAQLRQQRQPTAGVLTAAQAATYSDTAGNVYLQEQYTSLPQQPQPQPQHQQHRPGMPSAASAWPSGRPSSAAAYGSSKYPGSGSSFPPLQPACHVQARDHYSTALMAAAARRSRCQSPDVFKRLSASPLRPDIGSSLGPEGRQSNSPTEIERHWRGSLRDSDRSTSPAGRDSSRSRSCSPSAQHRESLVPWITPASAQGIRQSCPALSTGPVEWDAQRRSIKVDAVGGGWRNVSCRSPDEADDSNQHATSSPQKQPLILPRHVLEERMRRFYERNVDWKRRCALVYERQREAMEQGEAKNCTFTPVINKKSEKFILEGTARTSYPMRQIRPLTSMALTAQIPEQTWRKQKQQQQQQRRPASTGRIRRSGQHASWLLASAGASCEIAVGSRVGGSDQSMPPAVRRLYHDAALRLQRAEQYKEVTHEVERKARSWSAPRRPASEGVPSRVYDHLERSSSRGRRQSLRPTEAEVCSFQPWTNPRPQPKSPTVQRAAVRVQQAEQAVVEEFVALLDGDTGQQEHMEQQEQQHERQAKEAPCAHPQRQGTAPATAASSNHHQQQQQPRSPSAQRIGSASRNADLDWDEFIDRQSRFLSMKEAKVAAVVAHEKAVAAMPQLSPGTKRILADKQSLGISTSCHSPSTCRSGPTARSGCAPSSPMSHQRQENFLGRLEQQSQSMAGGSASSNDGAAGGLDSPEVRRQAKSSSGGSSGRSERVSEECTFKPRITAKAAAKKGRSVTEMSEGDRLRREVKLEQMRVLTEARELAGATFRPDLSPSRQREGECFLSVPPKLHMSSEGLSAYMASLQQKRRQLEERRRMTERKKQEEELRECTFKPETTPVPAYITEMADVGYTARYIDRVMQGALADGAGRLGPTVAAALKAMETPEPTGKGTKSGLAGPDPQTGKPELISTKY